jgi:hypothetical protein
MKLTLKHAIAAIILMLRFPTPGGAGPLEDADAAIKRRDYATAVRLIRPSPYSVPYLKRAVIAREGTNCPVARFAKREGMLVEEMA